nr:L,D-transpeptidase [Kofleriaceae bacterium]
MRRAACLLVVCAMAGQSAAEPGDLVAADLGWPTDARIAAFKESSRVLAAAGHGKRVARVAKGTRVTWQRIVPSQDACKAWLELDQPGWACASDLVPVTDVADAAAKAVAAPPKNAFVGVDLATGAALDFAWAVARVPGATIAVHDAPDAKAPATAQLSPRDIVAVHEVRGDWARVAGAELGDAAWVLVGELRQPLLHARPAGVADHERWLDVDLDTQILVAYDGDAPTFATLVSTGRPGDWQTPTGIYRIRDKDPKARMRYTPPESSGVTETWDVADVPFVMSFRRNFALHGAYWHDSFGRQRSHGCVNLSPPDAKRIYEFVLPNAPDGFADVEADGDGTPVVIHDRRDPSPKWLDYDGRPLAAVASSN